MQTYLVQVFTEKELKELVEDLYMDDTVDMLEELRPIWLPGYWIQYLRKTGLKSNELLNYPADSAGSIMTTEYVDLRKNMTVATGYGTYQRNRHPQGDDLYLLCDRTPETDRHSICQRTDDRRRQHGIESLMETEIISG